MDDSLSVDERREYETVRGGQWHKKQRERLDQYFEEKEGAHLWNGDLPSEEDSMASDFEVFAGRRNKRMLAEKAPERSKDSVTKDKESVRPWNGDLPPAEDSTSFDFEVFAGRRNKRMRAEEASERATASAATPMDASRKRPRTQE